MRFTGDSQGLGGIGYANSSDGISWTKFPKNPVLSKGDVWDDATVRNAAVVHNGTAYLMWYTGISSSYDWRIGLAEGWNAIPRAPMLAAPYDNLWLTTATPTFSWTFSDPDQYDNQTAFQVQLDDDPDFGSIDYDSGKNLSASSSHTPVTPIPDGVYNWRARVWDTDGDNSSWSASRKINIDTTGPLNPAGLWSRSHTIGKWSYDRTVDVNWSLPDGGALVSGYDGVSVEWDQSCSTVPDALQEHASDVLSETSPPMPDGDSIYFHIRAKDRAGNWAGGAAHLGPFWIDASAPQNPAEVGSPSHEPMKWSNDNTVDMAWTGGNAGLSGLQGYSVLWDNSQYTVPKAVVNLSAEVLRVSSLPLSDGNNWYFHLRTGNNAGNWAPGEVHLGPYYIDATAPGIHSLAVNGGAEFSSCRTARAVLRAEDAPGGSGLAGIRQRFNGGVWSDWQPYGDSIFFDLSGEDRQWTVEVQVRDAANNTSPAATATLLLDTGAPVVTGIRINHGANYTNSTSAVLSLSLDDPLPSSGVDLMSLSADGKNWGPWEAFRETRPYNLTAGDGTKTVSVRLRDNAGNIGPAASATIILDTVPPVTSVRTLPATVDDQSFTVNWSGADRTSGVSSFDVQYSDNGSAWTDWLLGTEVNSAVFTGVDGHNYAFRARARDWAGNLESYPSTSKNPVLVDIPRPLVSITSPEVDSTVSGRFTFKGTSVHPKAGLSVRSVQLKIDDGPWQDARGTTDWSFTLDTGRLGNGLHSVSVRAFDGTKYSREEPRAFSVRNGSGASQGANLLIMLVVALAAIAGVAVFVAVRRRGRAGAAAQAPTSLAQPARPATARTAAPAVPQRVVASSADAAATGMVLEDKISVEDLDGEKASPPAASPQRAPPAEPAPHDRTQAKAGGPPSQEPPAPRPKDETAMRESRVLKALSSLPRGLPSALWGIDIDELASRVVSGERKDSPDGKLLVRIGSRWYYGDETDPGLFMQEYKK
jgi:hypothetical protein